MEERSRCRCHTTSGSSCWWRGINGTPWSILTRCAGAARSSRAATLNES